LTTAGTAMFVEKWMTPSPQTILPGCPIEEAARTLRSNRIGALPVLRENRLVGIITESDVFEAFIDLTWLDALPFPVLRFYPNN